MNDHFSRSGSRRRRGRAGPTPSSRRRSHRGPRARIAAVPSQSPRARAPVRQRIVQAVEIGEDAVRCRSASLSSSVAARANCSVVSVVGPPSGAEVCRPVIEPGVGRSPRRSASSSASVRSRVQVFVEIVVDLQDRRVDAGAEAFDLGHGELPVGAGLAAALDAGDLAAGLRRPRRSRAASTASWCRPADGTCRPASVLNIE